MSEHPIQVVVDIEWIVTKPDGPFSRRSDKHFLATDEAAAVDAAWRWIRNRQREIPEHFGDVGAVTLYHFEPPYPDEDGMIKTSVRGIFYEWKLPYGTTDIAPKDVPRHGPDHGRSRFAPSPDPAHLRNPHL